MELLTGDFILFRVLNDSDDQRLLDAFLQAHRDSSMFLRSNLHRSGLTYRPEPFHAEYMALHDGACRSVAAHCWNGTLLLQAPESAAELAKACVKHSGRKVTAIVGPLEQVRNVRIALGLAETPAAVDADEALYALDLSEIVIPEALTNGDVVCRPPQPEERDTLHSWRIAYDIETLGATDSVETRDRAARFIDMQIADGNAWVALDGGNLVSLSAFNAALPDIVQLGGIYTPPLFRGRGYAKAAVAHSLLTARSRGATRAILFTDNPSAARSYEAVGFRRIGDYGMVLFR